MKDKQVIESFFRRCDRRRFLKAFGIAGAGLLAGGFGQSVFKVVPLVGGRRRVSQTRLRMGTFVDVTVVSDSRDRAEEAIELAFAEMDRLIAMMSRHDPSSALSVLNDRGALDNPPAELVHVLREAKRTHALTDGAFDVTVGPVVDLFRRSFQAGGPPSRTEIDDALELVSARSVVAGDRRVRLVRNGMQLTLDGIAKGFIVDRAARTLDSRGAADYLINAGGDVRTSGVRENGRPWRVAIEDPAKTHDYPAVLRLGRAAVATSGDYEAYFDEERTFHHVVDPASGSSPRDNDSVTVVTSNAMLADALSTAALVLPSARALSLIATIAGAECLFVAPTGGTAASSGFHRLTGGLNQQRV